MKNNKTLQFIMMVFAIIFGLNLEANATQDCEVKSYKQTGTGSIGSVIKELNKGNFCQSSIEIKVSNLIITETIEIKNLNTLEVLIDTSPIDGGDIVTIDARGLTGQKPIFKYTGNDSNILKFIGKFQVRGDNPFLECSKCNGVEVDYVQFTDQITTAIKIDGGSDVTIRDLDIIDTTANSQIISVTGSDNNNIVIDMSDESDIQNVNGTGLHLENITNLSVSGFAMESSPGRVAKLNNINTIKEFNVSGSNVGHGVIMDNIEGDITKDGSLIIDLQGRSDVAGIGLELNDNVQNLSFQNLSVRQFGSDGVVIRDSSNNNSFSGVYSYNNDGYGFHIADTVENTTLSGKSNLEFNLNCGLYLNSTAKSNVVVDTMIQNNGNNCAVDNAAHLDVSEDTVKLIPQSENTLLVDIDRDSVPANVKSIELQYVTVRSGSTSSDSEDSATQGNRVRNFKKFDLTLVPGFNNGNSDSTTVADDEEYMPGPSDKSWVFQDLYDDVTNNNLMTDIANLNVTYFALLKGQNGAVLGVWTGKAMESDVEDGLCYTDPVSNTRYRIVDPGLDSDEDGIPDSTEDGNKNCSVDEGETDPTDSDSDDDGLLDGQEDRNASGSKDDGETDPLNNDSDGDNLLDGIEDKDGDGNRDEGETSALDSDSDDDGLLDGEEDFNQNGVVDSNETDPLLKDSDGDGESDKDDDCPLVSGSDQCYYSNCIEGEIPAVGSDEDGDGIFSHLEDTNLNCKRDVGETDPSNADTDGDGISDGVEDYDQDGILDEGETSPILADTDGDCIVDGDEDKNGDGIVMLSDGETDPRALDSDGDGINDGEEDFSCDGNVDAGETAPYLIDTDGDNDNDDTDVCPWTQDPLCVVRFCGINGFEAYDTDGDTIPDSEEDSNGDCKHSPSEKESHPLIADTDEDGLMDNFEDCFNTNPNAADTDGDGQSDYEEVKNSLETCEVIFSSVNGEASDPLFYNRGGCSLNRNVKANPTTSIMMILGFVFLALLRARKEA